MGLVGRVGLVGRKRGIMDGVSPFDRLDARRVAIGRPVVKNRRVTTTRRVMTTCRALTTRLVMTMGRRSGTLPVVVAMAASLLTGRVALQAQRPPQLGVISFPTSATGPAQAAFVRGVLFLHNFEYDEALMAFREAQKLAPGLAMAYWGEALANTQPLWYNENLPRARAALTRLAPTAAERAAKAPTPREKGYLEAVEALFGAGDRLTRFASFASRLEVLSQQFPDDDEIRVFQALALLGSIPEGVRMPDVSLKAGALASAVLRKNPRHPGAAHYVLHAFDDGEHNAMALDAARVYARIAPASSHALHMPSHAFLPLGLWDEAAASDEAAFAASVAWVARNGRTIAQQDFHSLSWLQYAYLQQGRFGKAREVIATVERAQAASGAPGSGAPAASAPANTRALPGDAGRAAIGRPPGGVSSEIGRGYDAVALKNERASLRARLIIEGADWHLMKGQPSFDNIDELFALGLSSVALEDYGRAEAAVRELAQASSALPDRDAADLAALMREQIVGLLTIARGDQKTGLSVLARAAQREAARPKPIARPYPPKPAGELYAEALLGLGNPAAAVDEYRRALQRTPRRASSLLGLARALRASGQRAEAARTAKAFLEMWKRADSDRPELAEARDLLR